MRGGSTRATRAPCHRACRGPASPCRPATKTRRRPGAGRTPLGRQSVARKRRRADRPPRSEMGCACRRRTRAQAWCIAPTQYSCFGAIDARSIRVSWRATRAVDNTLSRSSGASSGARARARGRELGNTCKGRSSPPSAVAGRLARFGRRDLLDARPTRPTARSSDASSSSPMNALSSRLLVFVAVAVVGPRVVSSSSSPSGRGRRGPRCRTNARQLAARRHAPDRRDERRLPAVESRLCTRDERLARRLLARAAPPVPAPRAPRCSLAMNALVTRRRSPRRRPRGGARAVERRRRLGRRERRAKRPERRGAAAAPACSRAAPRHHEQLVDVARLARRAARPSSAPAPPARRCAVAFATSLSSGRRRRPAPGGAISCAGVVVAAKLSSGISPPPPPPPLPSSSW